MLVVETGSRLHFGLMELAEGAPHRFSGLGLMVEHPRLCVSAARVTSSQAQRSPLSDAMEARVRSACESASRLLQDDLARASPRVDAIQVETPVRLHAGLGAGTQLACSVASAVELLNSHHESQSGTHHFSLSPQAIAFPSDSTEEARARVQRLSALSGRGKRSAIGLYGFLYGGLILDRGYETPGVGNAPSARHPQTRSVDASRVDFPTDWPVVLILPRLATIAPVGSSVHGAEEESLIRSAGQNPNADRDAMASLAIQVMEATNQRNFDAFSSNLTDYMHRAGSLFRDVQQGLFRNEEIAQTVRVCQAAGLQAVGQSSWGPTVFGFAQSQSDADRAVQFLNCHIEPEQSEIVVTRALNKGAHWQQTV